MKLTLALVALLVVAPAAAGDRIVLDNGGTIDAIRWWNDGANVKIETASGVLAVPRTFVVRIEPASAPAGNAAATAPSNSKPAAAPVSTATAPAPASTGAPPPASEAPPREAPTKLSRLIDEGSEALRKRDFETAMLRFHEAIRLDPSRVDARTGYALAEIALGRDAAALSVVLDGLALDPKSADLHEVLGDIRDREERVEDALTSWREAFRLSPNDRRREKILKAERELAAGRDYAFSAAAHFNMRYDGEVDPDLAKEVEDHLERRYRELEAQYQHAPSQPIAVILYPKTEFHTVTQASESVSGLFDGKIRVPLGGLRRLTDPARRVLSHELAHAFIHARSRGQCPRWLHEGMAQLAEPRVSTPNDRKEVAALAAAADPLAWTKGDFSYPAALSLTRDLEQRGGFDALVRVLERLGSGEKLDEAIRGEFALDFGDIVRSWAATAQETPAR